MYRRYCFYRMTHDSGFAPNPFHGFCTLAACTPNHMRANLGAGDVIVGVESDVLIGKRRGKLGATSTLDRCIVYYMLIDERLTLDQYFTDPRFANKKILPGNPSTATYEQRCGDNVYYHDEEGQWRWLPGHEHDDDKGTEITETISKDIEGNRVFIGKTFYYFGDAAVPLPEYLIQHVPRKQGMQYYEGPLRDLDEYISTQAARLGKLGVIGEPIDWPAIIERVRSCGTQRPPSACGTYNKC